MIYEENDALYGMKIIEEVGDSENMKSGQIVSSRQLRDENSLLKRENKNIVIAREAEPATAKLNYKELHVLPYRQSPSSLLLLSKKQQKF